MFEAREMMVFYENMIALNNVSIDAPDGFANMYIYDL